MPEPIIVAPISTQEADNASTEASLALNKAQEIVIKDQSGYDLAAESLKAIKGRISFYEGIRKSLKAPILEAGKRIDDLFRKPIESYGQAETILKKSMIKYTDEQERIQREEEARLQREAEKRRKELEAKAEAARAAGKEAKASQYEEKAATVVAPTLSERVQQAKGVTISERWTAEVIDFTKLPDDYKLPDMSKLNKVAQATKGSLNISGVVFLKSRTLSSTKA